MLYLGRHGRRRDTLVRHLPEEVGELALDLRGVEAARAQQRDPLGHVDRAVLGHEEVVARAVHDVEEVRELVHAQPEKVRVPGARRAKGGGRGSERRIRAKQNSGPERAQRARRAR